MKDEDGYIIWGSGRKDYTTFKDGYFESRYGKKNIYDENDKTKIAYAAFRNYSIKEIKFPDYINYIGKNAFIYCHSIEKIILPQNLKVIYDGAFASCIELEKIEIPPNVQRIGRNAFSECHQLKEVFLPESITNIESDTFKECFSLEKINLPDSLKNIEAGSFKNCSSLKNIVFPSNIEKIGAYAFEYCNALESIYLPDSLKEVRGGAFHSCENLKEVSISASTNVNWYSSWQDDIFYSEGCAFSSRKKIKMIIRYKNYEEIKNFLSKLHTYYKEYLSLYSKYEIVIQGPKLDTLQRGFLKLNFPHEITYDFETIKNTGNRQDSKIEETINKISELCNNLPDRIKTDIMNKVNELVDNYKEDIEYLEPEYSSKEETTLSFNNPTIETVKPTLLSKLEIILFSLSSMENSKDFIENLDKYKNHLNEKIDYYSDGETTDDKIKNAIYFTKYMDDKKKEEIIYQLSKCIDNAIDFASLDINKLLENSDPELKFEGNYKTDFELKINELYNKANNDTKKIRGFVDLLDAINNKETDLKEGSDFKDLISNFNYVISKLSNNKYKENIEKEKNEKFNKYNDVLEKIINNEELQTSETLKEIEMSIRKDFQDILEDVQKYVYLDKYEENKGNKANLDTQLKTSLDIINSYDKVELTEEYKLQPITSYVIEIQNKITGNTSINYETKTSIREEIKNKLNKWINHLENDLVDDLNEYNDVLSSILKDIAETDVHLGDYLDDIEDYEKVVNNR